MFAAAGLRLMPSFQALRTACCGARADNGHFVLDIATAVKRGGGNTRAYFDIERRPSS